MRQLHFILFCMTCMLLAMVPKVTHAQTVSACYAGTCYPSLSAAVTAMQADPVYGGLLRQTKSRIVRLDAASTVSTITYEVADQPAEVIWGAGYVMSGWAVDPLGCQPSETRPDSCGDEAELISLFTTYWKTNVYSADCTLRNERIAGSHPEPFSQVQSHYTGSSGNTGTLQFYSDKRWELEINCPGWGTPEFDYRSHPISKQVSFKCRIGFYAKDGWAPAYLPAGADASNIVEWPNLCWPAEKFREIQVTTTQVASCGTAHPCHPTTGDKSRAERDFVFAGRSFTRNYHSLNQLKGHSGSAPGWSHTFEERLEFYYSTPTLFSAEGYLETFTELSNYRYRGNNSSDRILERGSDGLFTLTDASGTVKTFVSDGRLLAIRNANDPSSDVSLAYLSGRLSAVTDASGRSILFSYSKSLLAKIVLPDGVVVSYGYDADNNLIAVDYGDGAIKRYHYHEAGLATAAQVNHLTGISSEGGARYASFGYDATDRVTSSRLHGPAGYVEQTSLDYQSDTSVVVTTDGRGVRTYNVQPGLYRRLLDLSDSAGTSTTSYRTDGRVDAVVSADGTRTNYEYAETYRSAVVEAVGTGSERRVTTQRDASNRVIRRETWGKTSGVLTLARIDLITYDINGRPSATCLVDAQVVGAQSYVCGSASNAPAGVRQTLRSYCEQADVDAGTCPLVGLVKAFDGARTDVPDVTSYTYRMADEASCAAAPTTCAYRKGDLWKVTNALGQVSETVKSDGAGRLLSVKDANGVVTDMEYHPRGWLTASKVRGTNAGSESDDLITRIEYEPTGLVKKTTLPDGSSTGFTYDAAHRLTDITDGDGNRLHYTLDNAGNKTKEDTLASNGSVQRTLSRVFNQLGQLQTNKDAYNQGTGFSYDATGNTDTVTDALGKVSDNNYDPLSRLTQTIQDLGGINATTKFEYDTQDNLTAVIDPKALATRYVYNGLGDLTKLTSPDTGVTSYTYDSAGNRKTQTDARLKVTTYGYDALNRLTTIGYATTALNVTYTYDVGNTVCTVDERFSTGRLTKLKDGSGTTQFCYNRFGQLTRKLQTTNGKLLTLRYSYTPAGRLSGITYPNGMAVDYPRDALGRVTQVGVTLPGGVRQVLLQQAVYYPFGPAAEWVFGNGRLFQRTLNQNYQSGVVQDGFPGGLSVGYEFDEVGNLSTLRNGNQNDPPQRLFGYDALNRLTQAKDGTTNALLQGFAYDATGNRQSATVGAVTTAYTTVTTSHRLSKVGTVSRGYDAAGSTTSIGGTARGFVYDAAGRMSQAKQNNAVAMNYLYNGKGEQVRRYLGTVNTYTAYDEAGHWLGDYDTAGAPTQQAIWLDDLPVGVVAAGKLHYIEADALGTPRVVIDPLRDVSVWKWDLAGC